MSDDPMLAFMAYAEPSSSGSDGGSAWEKLVGYIGDGNVVPIISNSLRDDRFMAMFNMPDEEMGVLISRLLAEGDPKNPANPNNPKYPLPDKSDLARVAQFRQVTSGNREEAKRDYLKWLTGFIIRWAKQNDPRARAIIEDENLERTPNLLYGDLLAKFRYPTYPEGVEDPLRLLAKLDLPIYITTSYYEFLEQALVAEGKQPRTQVCTWAGKTSLIAEKHLPSPSPVDDRARALKEPLVFHLFGLERYPHTIVLSVDDYLDFLVNIFLSEGQTKTSEVTGAPRPIPPYLWEKITDLQLLLLGYRLQDWEFQVLYRGLITAKPTAKGRDAGLIIQLEPDEKRGVTNPKAVASYLTEYFKRDVRFQVEFGKPDAFIAKVYEAYRQRS